ncbi:MAG TPA: xanthine dehydrogenase family protein molybdopterin-binding subunit [Terriglobales bacterium]|nr:xanthine dehydrogenase family protein molybdopterin-binding subunit [Terriglobales bacterium]
MSPLSRRSFLGKSAAAGAGLVIGVYLPRGARAAASSSIFSPNAYLRITPDNKIVVMVARSEMGQGVWTALPMILAEELEVDLKQITIEQAGASTLFGDQGTGGSASVRTTWDPMRKAGAQAREMLISAAAEQWSVPTEDCKAENGYIIHSFTNRKASYGELADAASKFAVPKDPPLKTGDYKIVGKSLPRLDTPSKVNGSAKYGIDVRLPEMKYAVLARCQNCGGKILDFDATEAKQVPGVSSVDKISDVAIAVVADNTWNAMKGRRALKVNWDVGANKDLDSAAIFDTLHHADQSKAVKFFTSGDVSKAAGKKIEAEYQLPFMAHAPMEPGNCTAHFRGNECELWAPTQVPQDCRDAVAQVLGLKPEQVKVNVTLLGGGFGRRLEHDYAVEAALVSKAINAPVKVTWTREDDMRCSPYRPVSLHKLSANIGEDGWPSSFVHRTIAPSISAQKGQPGSNGVDPDFPDEASFLYPIPNVSLESVATETPVPLGWMRSVYALQMAFASESFIDELAAVAGKDPLAYRLHLLAKDAEIKYFDTSWSTARLRNVLKLAALKSGWSKPLPAGRFRGIACFGCFSTYAADVVEISMEKDEPKVHRVVSVVDCGQVVNPNILEQQIQSAVIYGLANALRAQITIKNGRVVQGNFDEYQPIRMNEAPKVEAYFVPSTEPPTGIGEPPLPPLAPAICNAIFAATKKRVRALPILNS